MILKEKFHLWKKTIKWMTLLTSLHGRAILPNTNLDHDHALILIMPNTNLDRNHAMS
jgi:hypothetical protein